MALTHASSPDPLSRRALLGSVLVGSASLVFRPLAAPVRGAESNVASGSWRPWLLSSSDELRPARPLPPTSDELAELVALQGQRTATTLVTIARWDDPTVVLPWTNLTLDLIRVHTPNPVRAGRALALVHVALYDALVAAADARATYPRPGPATDKAIVPLGTTVPEASSFPSDQAAVAAAASTVLAPPITCTFLLPVAAFAWEIAAAIPSPMKVKVRWSSCLGGRAGGWVVNTKIGT